jgi:transposase
MEQSQAKQSRRRFDHQFKVDAVRLSEEPGKTVAEVARNLGVTRSQLDRWRKDLRAAASVQAAFPGNGNLGADKKELEEMRRELARVKEEREILKKAMAVFSRRP